MKQSLLGIAVGATLASITLTASAASLTTSLTYGTTSPISGATTIDFGTSAVNNGGPVQNPMTTFGNGFATYSGGELFNTSTSGVSGVAARPVGSTGNFWSIEGGEIGWVSFTSGISYYGFLWGSPDTSPWNEVFFYNGDTLLGSYGREDFKPQLNDNYWTTTAFLNVSTTGSDVITKIKFTASQNAFETDNHAYVSAVPLPAALPLMLSGLGLLGFASRRRKNQA